MKVGETWILLFYFYLFYNKNQMFNKAIKKFKDTQIIWSIIIYATTDCGTESKNYIKNKCNYSGLLVNIYNFSSFGGKIASKMKLLLLCEKCRYSFSL
jgi:hypothetical protein